MKIFKTIASFTFFVAVNFNAAAQQFAESLQHFSSTSTAEKIYIHYDKDYYVAGETVWFKAYLYNEGKPGSTSNNLYLQLMNGDGKVICSKMIPVESATAKGNFDIPDSLMQGNYYVRALTANMLNMDEAFIYKKSLVVFNPSNKPVAKLPAQEVSLLFFPESGDLVEGIISVVAFKAVDQWGVPVAVTGAVRSDDGAMVTGFKTYHDGIGRLQFKVQSGKKYIAEIETASGKKTYSFPEVKQSGINLKVQDEKGGKKFQLFRSEKEKDRFETLILVAEINNHVVYENEIAFENYLSITGHLLTDSLPSGILHFTVFNKDRVPLAERLAFVDNKEYLSAATINAIKISPLKKASGTIELNFSEQLQRRYSVAVTDASVTDFDDKDNICSHLLLTSDLKGKIYNPAWYFQNHGDTSAAALDNLMLTHGWSRFNWSKVLTSNTPLTLHTDQPFIVIKGKAVDERSNNALANGKLDVYLESEDSTTRQYQIPVNDAGNFALDSLIFFGKSKLYYVYSDAKGKAKPASIVTDSNTQQRRMDALLANLEKNSSLPSFIYQPAKEDVPMRSAYIKSLQQEKGLEKVTIAVQSGKKPVDIVNEKYATGVYREPGKVMLDNINNPVNDKSLNAVDYIKNRIRQLDIQNNSFVNRKNFTLATGQKWRVGVLLNEAPADMLQLSTLKADDIALVKFYEAGFVGVGTAFPGGAVVVYTKEKSGEEAPHADLKYIRYNGYSVSKEYYHPDYSAEHANDAIADKRTTLYWNPDVFMDAAAVSFKINFFNNDFSSKFRIVVEGFDAAGKLIHVEKIIGN